MTKTLIKNFTQISKADTEIAGGKGASLGEMTQAGIPVPEGFVILSNAFDRFLEETDLNFEIDAVLDTVDIKKVHTVENASEKIQAMILSKEMPEDIKAEILRFYKKLDCKFVAVRSSATSEDSASAAWAGQLDSFLNTTEETLLENIKRCWASLFTPRAIFYRFEKKLSKDKISVAVVVQKMVDSEKSGIAFSVHPITHDKNQIIIEAGFGLGEAIVSGSITPDSYVVDKQGFSILDINVNDQTKALYKKTKGGNEWKKLGEKGKKQVLTGKEIIELSKLIIKIENHYGFPCDIEWAKEKGKFYIVQSRPITTLHKTVSNNKNIDKYKYFGFWSTSPFAAWYWIDWNKSKYSKFFELDSLINGSVFAQGGHYLIQQTDYAHLKSIVVCHIKDADSTFFSDFKKYADDAFRYFQKQSKNLNWNPSNEKEFNNLISEAFPIMFFWILGHLISEILQEILDNFVRENKKTDFNLQMLKPSSKTMMESYFDEIRQLRLLVKYKLLSNELDKKKVESLLKNKKFNKIIDDLSSKYAWIKSFKFSKTTLTANLIIEDILSIQDSEEKNIIQSTNMELARIINSYNDVAYARNSAAEQFSFFSFQLANNFLESVSKKLDISYSDVLLFTPNELSDIMFNGKRDILKKSVYRVKNEWLLHKDAKTGDVIIVDDTKEIKDFFDKFVDSHLNIGTTNDEFLYGQSANGGKAKGLVKVIVDQKDFHNFIKGDILVTSMTTPDFVVLMKQASAIITDIGGMLTHAAIVSRELGLPCIVGTKVGTKALKDGDMVEVDANNGIVRILKKKK
jgi:phosphohistidine swiveling domain-containing protein